MVLSGLNREKIPLVTTTLKPRVNMMFGVFYVHTYNLLAHLLVTSTSMWTLPGV